MPEHCSSGGGGGGGGEAGLAKQRNTHSVHCSERVIVTGADTDVPPLLVSSPLQCLVLCGVEQASHRAVDGNQPTR